MDRWLKVWCLAFVLWTMWAGTFVFACLVMVVYLIHKFITRLI